MHNNDIKIYSTHNNGKSAIAEGFIRPFKNKIYEDMTSVSKNMYIHELDDIVNKCNNTYHSTIKMKSVDVKSDTFNDSSKNFNEKYPKFKDGLSAQMT